MNHPMPSHHHMYFVPLLLVESEAAKKNAKAQADAQHQARNVFKDPLTLSGTKPIDVAKLRAWLETKPDDVDVLLSTHHGPLEITTTVLGFAADADQKDAYDLLIQAGADPDKKFCKFAVCKISQLGTCAQVSTKKAPTEVDPILWTT